MLGNRLSRNALCNAYAVKLSQSCVAVSVPMQPRILEMPPSNFSQVTNKGLLHMKTESLTTSQKMLDKSTFVFMSGKLRKPHHKWLGYPDTEAFGNSLPTKCASKESKQTKHISWEASSTNASNKWDETNTLLDTAHISSSTTAFSSWRNILNELLNRWGIRNTPCTSGAKHECIPSLMHAKKWSQIYMKISS